ncbi:Fic family protein [Methanosarcina barkeri]|uniref:Fic family protein n=1 Tax=Methanosarcina barkeri TaxID=2208 RepID=UPI00064F2EC5
MNALLKYCIEPRSREEIQNFMGLKDRKHLRLEILNPLIQEGKLLLTIPEKPTSPNQKYYSKSKGSKNV